MENSEEFKNLPDMSGVYRCPNCGKMSEVVKTLIYQTEAIFEHVPDVHYEWVEVHKCDACGTKYKYNNAT